MYPSLPIYTKCKMPPINDRMGMHMHQVFPSQHPPSKKLSNLFTVSLLRELHLALELTVALLHRRLNLLESKYTNK